MCFLSLTLQTLTTQTQISKLVYKQTILSNELSRVTNEVQYLQDTGADEKTIYELNTYGTELETQIANIESQLTYLNSAKSSFEKGSQTYAKQSGTISSFGG